MGGFSGKTVVITGASSGIGLTAAKCFAREGASVCIVARDQAKVSKAVEEIKTENQRIRGYACDISNPSLVRDTARQIISECGAVHVLINNAGGFTQKIPWEQVSDEIWNGAIHTNLLSIYYCVREFAQIMISQGIQGSIINVGSSSGLQPKAGRIHYTVTKAAVHTMTKALALELAAHGIRVNAVAPGPTLTEKIQERFLNPLLKASELERMRKIPLQRMGQMEEIADALLFLASAKASFITGAILPVDGGYTIGG